MALARDVSTNGGSTSGTSLSFSHTCSGSNRILFVAARITGSGTAGTDYVTGVTYNGVAMTRVGRARDTTNNFEQVVLYVLINPATGSNTVVISTSASVSIYGSAVSYTGAKQSGQPDASTTNASTSSPMTTTVTTIADNCWLTGVASNGSGFTVGAGTGTVGLLSMGTALLGDSDGAKTPAGSFSMGWTGGTPDLCGVMCSIAPAPVFTITTTETLNLTDTVVRSTTKVFSETLSLTETFTKSITKFFTEGIIFADLTATISRIISITKTEVLSFVETLSVQNLWTRRTKPSTAWTDRTEPSSAWTGRTKPSTSWTNRTEPSTSWTDRTPPTTPWT